MYNWDSNFILQLVTVKHFFLFIYFDAGQLAVSQYPESPATGHLDTGFSWFPWVQERMLRWFPPFQVAATCFSCSPPDLNSVVTNCLLSYYVKWPLPPGENPAAVNKYYYKYIYLFINKCLIVAFKIWNMQHSAWQ